jgi:hypothetical protein
VDAVAKHVACDDQVSFMLPVMIRSVSSSKSESMGHSGTF